MLKKASQMTARAIIILPDKALVELPVHWIMVKTERVIAFLATLLSSLIASCPFALVRGRKLIRQLLSLRCDRPIRTHILYTNEPFLHRSEQRCTRLQASSSGICV